jgi:hypothetical protein
VDSPRTRYHRRAAGSDRSCSRVPFEPETIGSKFGGIPQGFPAFNIPRFRPDLILPLLPSAFTVAILAAVESLLSAVVSDSMTGDRHNSNVELVAQGAANLLPGRCTKCQPSLFDRRLIGAATVRERKL